MPNFILENHTKVTRFSLQITHTCPRFRVLDDVVYEAANVIQTELHKHTSSSLCKVLVHAITNQKPGDLINDDPTQLVSSHVEFAALKTLSSISVTNTKRVKLTSTSLPFIRPQHITGGVDLSAQLQERLSFSPVQVNACV